MQANQTTNCNIIQSFLGLMSAVQKCLSESWTHINLNITKVRATIRNRLFLLDPWSATFWLVVFACL